MYIGISTEDFDILKCDWSEAFSTETEHPIITGMTVEEVAARIDRYFRLYVSEYYTDVPLPKYEIHAITTVATVKGDYECTTECCPVNSD